MSQAPGSLCLSTQMLPLSALDDSLIADWANLSDRAVEPNPFFSPEFLLPAAKWLPDGDAVKLAVVRRGLELVLAVPIVRGRYRIVPVDTLTTWHHTHRYLGTPLVAPDSIEVAPAALLEALTRSASTGWLALEQLYIDGSVARAFRAAADKLSATWVQPDVWGRPVVNRRKFDTYLDGTVSARSAKGLRRRRRNLIRDHGPIVCEDIARKTDPRAVEAGIQMFLKMEAAGWKGRAGTALACDRSHAAFWRETCLRLADAGRLEMWQFKAGATMVAQQCHVHQGDTVFHLKTTYDEGLRKYSPGVQLELELLQAFHGDGALEWLDSCTDQEPSTSARLYPDTRRVGDVLIGLTGPGRVITQLTPYAAKLWRKRPWKPG